MLAMKDHERLYLDSWNYNALLILDELRKLIERHGGRVKPCRTAVITNRSLSSAHRDYTAKLERLLEADAQLEPNPQRSLEIYRLRVELEGMSVIPNDPIEVPGQNFIRFILDEAMYSFSLDDNPFFEFYYIKTPFNHENNTYSGDACSEEFGKGWLSDCLLSYRCTDDDRRKAANEIFYILTHSDYTQVVRSSRRVRVPNRYDGGYHMETIYDKERVSSIDF